MLPQRHRPCEEYSKLGGGERIPVPELSLLAGSTPTQVNAVQKDGTTLEDRAREVLSKKRIRPQIAEVAPNE